ncbi:hypothetical protein GCM10023196_094210 [Actinoallomurus vinaceus]|uniref:Secreted protein n=1 Tax=Actinoallomurus vinaceus TaxID=1080074 RepID=A0ABP8URE6_9ACTN
MDTKNRRRKPVLIAAVVVGGVAATVTAVAPSTSTPRATAAAAARVTAGASGRPVSARPVSGDPKVSLVVTTASPANTGRDLQMCAATHGKYQGTIVRTFPVIGDTGAAKGKRGGTLIVMRSTVCGTAWAQVEKDAKHDRRAYGTNVWIAAYATEPTDHTKDGESYQEATTRAVLSTKTVPLRAHGRIEVGAGWAGDDFAFNTSLLDVTY